MAPAEPPSPAAAAARPPVYLHIGTPKSGTTYLQNVLWRNRGKLREQGVLYPGDNKHAHVQATFDLRETSFGGRPNPANAGAWDRMVDAVRRWDRGPAIISQELLSQALPHHVERALRSLDFADVHIVLTVRDLARQLPAAWQETVKNRSLQPYEEFLTAIQGPPADWTGPVRAFWNTQDVARVLRSWAAQIPPERVHLVTVPPSGAPRGLLWERFCSVVGIDPARCDTGRVFSNASLGAAEAELVRRINVAVRHKISWQQHNLLVKRHIAQEVLPRRQGMMKIDLPADRRSWVAARSRELVAPLRDGGYHVVGDLDELLVPGNGSAGLPEPVEPTAADMLDAACDAIGWLLERRAQLSDVPDEVVLETQRNVMELREESARLLDGATPLSRRAIRRLSERYPAVMRLRESYWRYVSDRDDVRA